MTALERRQSDAAIRQHLFFFVWTCFSILEPGEVFIQAWHVRAMAYALQQAIEGGSKRLLITVPPRHLKSFLTSIALPAFILGRNPSARIMVASYGQELATHFGRRFRTLMRSPEYRRLFPSTTLDSSKCTENEVWTEQGGYRLSVSPTGAVTGLGADILIIDDLMKASDASSPLKRQEAKRFYDEVLFSRVNNKSEGSIIAIQQRLQEDDFAAYLIDKGFEHLCLRAIAETDEQFALSDGHQHQRRKGEALFPQHEPLETLEDIRRQIGETPFSAQYQQNPTAEGGNMLRWEWFKTRHAVLERHELQYVVQSWDTAYLADPNADYSVCLTWGFKDDVWHLLDVWRRQVGFPELKAKALSLARQWRPDKIIIEHAGSGISLYHELRESHRRPQLIAYKPRVSKEERFAQQSSKVADGLVSLPSEALWLEAFKRELQAFPNGRNDDMADAFAQFLDWTGKTNAPESGRAAVQSVRRNIRRRNPRRRLPMASGRSGAC